MRSVREILEPQADSGRLELDAQHAGLIRESRRVPRLRRGLQQAKQFPGVGEDGALAIDGVEPRVLEPHLGREVRRQHQALGGSLADLGAGDGRASGPPSRAEQPLANRRADHRHRVFPDRVAREVEHLVFELDHRIGKGVRGAQGRPRGLDALAARGQRGRPRQRALDEGLDARSRRVSVRSLRRLNRR